MLDAELTSEGNVHVDGRCVGRLTGFRFTLEKREDGIDGNELRAAATHILVRELSRRAERLGDAPDTDIVMAADGTIRWLGEPVGRMMAGETILSPRVHLLADDILPVSFREKAEERLKLWVDGQIEKSLAPLKALKKAEDLSGLAASVASRLVESLGVVERTQIAEDIKSLDQEQRTQLRKFGVRFGAYHIYLPLLLKPAPRVLAAQLWGLSHTLPETEGLVNVQALAASGRTSFMADLAIDREFYRLLGYRVCSERAVRVDILERLADIIRPAVAFRVGVTEGLPPEGAAEGNGFTVTIAMTSLVGCAGEDFAKILRSLGYKMELRPAAVVAPDTSKVLPLEVGDATQDSSVQENVSGELALETEASQPDTVGEGVENGAVVEEPLQPVMVEVWRPAFRQEQRRSQVNRNEGGKSKGHSQPSRRSEQLRSANLTLPENATLHQKHAEERRDKFNNRGARPSNGKPYAKDQSRKSSNRAPDPDSPFAALLALKEKMGKK